MAHYRGLSQPSRRLFMRVCGWSLLYSLLLFFGMHALPAEAEEYSAEVVAVGDGDSITVLHDGTREKVIFYGIDCPELKQDFGTEARAFTNDACYHKTVKLDVKGQDSRGRTIARVFLANGTDLNKKLVQKGLAWWSDKYAPNDKELKSAHLAARASKSGLWSSANVVPPWIFRNGERSVKATLRPAQPE